jgi:hypothetical protein
MQYFLGFTRWVVVIVDVGGQVAFFTAGSMVQLTLSVLISAIALVYHAYALPFRDRLLNGI